MVVVMVKLIVVMLRKGAGSKGSDSEVMVVWC